MPDFGPAPYLTAAVQVIPVLVVAAVLDQRDASDEIERRYASTSLSVGLLFGLGGCAAALWGLLYGPFDGMLTMVNAGLLALTATVLGPRLIEFFLPGQPDVARRITHRFLPSVIGTVGLVYVTWDWPVTARIVAYVLLGLSLLLRVVTVRGELGRQAKRSAR